MVNRIREIAYECPKEMRVLLLRLGDDTGVLTKANREQGAIKWEGLELA